MEVRREDAQPQSATRRASHGQARVLNCRDLFRDLLHTPTMALDMLEAAQHLSAKDLNERGTAHGMSAIL